MSSGHSAGLQKARDFHVAEWKIQRRRHEEVQEMVDRHGMGEPFLLFYRKILKQGQRMGSRRDRYTKAWHPSQILSAYRQDIDGMGLIAEMVLKIKSWRAEL
jgi:hypothetical protein